jgi:hypothetical protein
MKLATVASSRNLARTISAGAGAVLATVLFSGQAWAAGSYGPINAKNDNGRVVATGRGQFYYNSQSNPAQQSTFRDTLNDGNKVYMVANFQSRNQICPPRGSCYYGYQNIYAKDTARYDQNAGTVTIYLTESRRGLMWRDLADVCGDVAWAPDDCASSGWVYP